MESLEEVKEVIEQHRQGLGERFKVRNIAVFGSFARGEQDEESDVDILVEFKEPVGFLFVHLADLLEQILRRKVDLVTKDAIKPNRRKYIMEALIYV